MAEGVNTNEIVIQQTFSIPIGEEGKARFLSSFSKNLEVEYNKAVRLVSSENSQVVNLINGIGSWAGDASSKEQVTSLVSGMLFGYKLIRDSATSRKISIPVIDEKNAGDLFEEFCGDEMDMFLKLEQREIIGKDPIFGEIMSSLSQYMSDRGAFYQGAIIIHNAVNRKNKEIGIIPGRYEDILVKE